MSRSIIEVLQNRANDHGSRIAYTFLLDGEKEVQNLTYACLDSKARKIAGVLKNCDVYQKPVILLLPSSCQFVEAFFGCLYAGAIPVPLNPPRSKRHNTHLHAVIKELKPEVLLTLKRTEALIELDEDLPAMTTILMDDLSMIEGKNAVDGYISTASIAYLQFTSGSTQQPRGVTVRHGQLADNIQTIWRVMEQGEDSLTVTWLPLFHDMGLVGTVLTPLYFGSTTVLMSTWHFMQKPIRWLQAISNYRATSSGGPNFAYDLCISRTTPEERSGLNLSSWSLAFNGAEPVRAKTIERFTTMFASSGFRKEAFYPCYGLAEATLFVTGGRKPDSPKIHSFYRDDLRQGRVRKVKFEDKGLQLVCCGRIIGKHVVKIVNPDTKMPCQDNEIGEVWISGTNVSGEYWNNPKVSSATFGARLQNGEGPFLRTGDLGFLFEEELFLNGRLKDVLIVRGHNFYAHDIEHSVQNCHPSLWGNRGTIIQLFQEEQEDHLVYIQEISIGFNKPDLEGVIQSIRNTVALEFGLTLNQILLVGSGRIPKTSSGKTKRNVCRDRLLDGTIKYIYEKTWKSPQVNGESKNEPHFHLHSPHFKKTEVSDWLKNEIASLLGCKPLDVPTDKPMGNFGFSSLTAVELTGKLEKFLDRKISPKIFYEFPTIDALTSYLTRVHTQEKLTIRQEKLERDEGPIAIVGLGCRFPKSPNPTAYWELLRSGRNAITEVPPSRWDSTAFYDPTMTKSCSMNTKWGGFLEDISGFDSDFFGISQAEADSMDPQQRLLLEVAWEALEDAGVSLQKISGSDTGVFIGISTNDYSRRFNSGKKNVVFWSTGNATSIAANRLSFFFDLHGPSIAVDTACSSSLVALHLACQSIWAGQCEMAIVGGANVILSPDITINFSQAGATSGDGQCKAFDQRADGIVRGEGAGVVILKRLKNAVSEKDHVYAVIKGISINQDGTTNSLTAPNPKSQAAVIRSACNTAGIQPHTVQYVETHGAGTILGDPIELEALASVISGPERLVPCWVGSVKTNIGHLEAAAGMASLIKVAMALKFGEIPQNLHFQKPNNRISFESLKLRVPTTLQAWPYLDTGIRRAGLSGFGFGGTNVHVILESRPDGDEPSQQYSPQQRNFHPLVLSAPTSEALLSLTRTNANYFRSILNNLGPNYSIDCLVYTVGERRTHHRHRFGVSFRSFPDLVKKLDQSLTGSGKRTARWGQPLDENHKGPVFVFSGLDSGVCHARPDLMKEPIFRTMVSACNELTRHLVSWSVEDVFLEHGMTSSTDLLKSQLALLTLQLSLTALWKSWGIEPTAVVGHSVGEVSAAYVSGALDLQDAFSIVDNRCRLLKKLVNDNPRAGSMAAVRLSLPEIDKCIMEGGFALEIAAHNGPLSTVCAGEKEPMESFLKFLSERDIPFRLIPSPGPGHTSYVEPVCEELAASLGTLVPKISKIPLFSTVTGAECEGQSLGPHYWSQHLRKPVDLTQAIGAAVKSGWRIFLEIGPGVSISPAVAACLAHLKKKGMAIPSLIEGQADQEAMTEAITALHIGGYSPQWESLYPRGRCVKLPGYPWQRKNHWISSEPSEQLRPQQFRSDPNPLLGHRLDIGMTSGAIWETELDESTLTCLRDHVVGGTMLLPGTAYLEMCLKAAEEIFGSSHLLLRNVEFVNALFIQNREVKRIQTFLESSGAGDWRFEVKVLQKKVDRTKSLWCCLARGNVCLKDRGSEWNHVNLSENLDSSKSGKSKEVAPNILYQTFAQRGISYGPLFQRVQALWKIEEMKAFAKVNGLESPHAESEHVLRPAILDACLQPLGVTGLEETPSLLAGYFLPVSLGEVRIIGSLIGPLWSYVKRKPEKAVNPDVFRGDILVFNRHGDPVAEMIDFTVRSISPQSDVKCERALIQVAWESVPTFEDNLYPPEQSIPAHSWIILHDQKGIGKDLVRRLESLGECVELPFHQNLNANSTQPQIPNQFVSEIIKLPGTSYRIVDLRAIDSKFMGDESPEELNNGLLKTCGSLIDLMQALHSTSSTKKDIRLWLITQGAITIDAAHSVDPMQYPLWSLGRAISLEQTQNWAGIIDIDPGERIEKTVDSLVKELLNNSNEQQIAWRNGYRYVARLSPLGINPEWKRIEGFRTDGTYLITGGLGDLGFLVAKWLVRNGARRLILLGRTGLPPRKNWHLLENEIVSKHRADSVLQLESMGAAIHLAEVDLGNTPGVTAYLDKFHQEQWPGIKGVFHLAGIVQGQLVANMDRNTLIDHFRAKAMGAWILHQYFRGKQLDFFIGFSSGSVLIGSPGLGAYAAANSFLDALFLNNCGNQTKTLSINWGFWQNTGMAARYVGTSMRDAVPHGMLGMTDQNGLKILEDVFNYPLGNLGVMPFDWQEWAKFHPQTANNPYFSRLLSEKEVRFYEEKLNREKVFAMNPTERTDFIKSYFQRHLARILQIEQHQVKTDTPLTEMGVDSLMGLELKNRIEEDFGVTFPIVSILQGPTVSNLAYFVITQLAAETSDRSKIIYSQESDRKIEEEEARRFMDEINELSDKTVDDLLDHFRKGEGVE